MWISNCLLLQADVFSFGVILYEIFVGEITSQMVVGPTGDAMAAELYASKVIITSPPILHQVSHQWESASRTLHRGHLSFPCPSAGVQYGYVVLIAARSADAPLTAIMLLDLISDKSLYILASPLI